MSFFSLRLEELEQRLVLDAVPWQQALSAPMAQSVAAQVAVRVMESNEQSQQSTLFDFGTQGTQNPFNAAPFSPFSGLGAPMVPGGNLFEYEFADLAVGFDFAQPQNNGQPWFKPPPPDLMQPGESLFFEGPAGAIRFAPATPALPMPEPFGNGIGPHNANLAPPSPYNSPMAATQTAVNGNETGIWVSVERAFPAQMNILMNILSTQTVFVSVRNTPLPTVHDAGSTPPQQLGITGADYGIPQQITREDGNALNPSIPPRVDPPSPEEAGILTGGLPFDLAGLEDAVRELFGKQLASESDELPYATWIGLGAWVLAANLVYFAARPRSRRKNEFDDANPLGLIPLPVKEQP